MVQDFSRLEKGLHKYRVAQREQQEQEQEQQEPVKKKVMLPKENYKKVYVGSRQFER